MHKLVCVYVCVAECMFFPGLKLSSLSAGPQFSSVIWHVSHSQFPPLMLDSFALRPIGNCREKSTTTARLSLSHSAGALPRS